MKRLSEHSERSVFGVACSFWRMRRSNIFLIHGHTYHTKARVSETQNFRSLKV